MNSVGDWSRILLLKYPPMLWPNIAAKYAFCLWCFATPTVDCVLACCGKWLRNQKTPYTTCFGLLTLRQANMGYEKYSLHLIFIFYLNRDTSVLELFPVAVFQWKYILRVDPFTRQSKPSLELEHSAKKNHWRSYPYILLQTRTHIMTIKEHDSVLYALSVPDWSEMCGVVNVLTVLLLSPTRYILIIYSDTAGEIVKVLCQEVDMYMEIHLSIYI